MPTYSNVDPSSTRQNARRLGGGFLYDALKATIDAITYLIRAMLGK